MENIRDDKFFITEIINDLERYDYTPGGKAQTMLRDWARELRERSRVEMPASRLRRTFNAEVGAQNW